MLRLIVASAFGDTDEFGCLCAGGRSK